MYYLPVCQHSSYFYLFHILKVMISHKTGHDLCTVVNCKPVGMETQTSSTEFTFQKQAQGIRV